ncbi:hypothetical protein AB833_31415 [Chromatiales bacterium (ex Bugula neritina AB1)]|nr:hypothetical protein AB833_31415 [Chromatiales bacterium (ex Bugula neritina AB1)]
MKATVYIESSVISYLTARPSNDLVKSARQAITSEWWTHNLPDFEVYVSELVELEISQGDSAAAAARMEVTASIENLAVSEKAQEIAEQLVIHRAVPATCPQDALHIGIAASNGIEFLLTWNFKHINNAYSKANIRTAIERFGFQCPELCSPEELRAGDN